MFLHLHTKKNSTNQQVKKPKNEPKKLKNEKIKEKSESHVKKMLNHANFDKFTSAQCPM
jgi:hypothetical protein